MVAEYEKTKMTLTCDASAKPVGLVPVKHVVARLAAATIDSEASGEVQVLLEDKRQVFRAQHITINTPVIAMFPSYIELTKQESSFVSRRVLFARDGWGCQYCDFQARPRQGMKELTLDHVKPARMFPSRGDATTWENVTTACKDCNRKKGGLLPRDCQMMPRRTPKKPNFVQVRFAGRLSGEQRDYVRDYFGDKVGDFL